MPTYEYLCQRCGERLEVFQSFTAKSLRTHRGCGGRLEKVLYPRGVIFKGSGFYTTDSRKALPTSKTSTKESSDVSASSKSSKDSKDSKGSKGSKGSRGSKGSEQATASSGD